MKSTTKKILIIGSTGFLGSALTQLLNKEGFSTHTANRSLFDLSKPISSVFEEYIKGLSKNKCSVFAPRFGQI